MRDLNIKFGDARDHAQQSIEVNVHEGVEQQAIDLGQLKLLLDVLREQPTHAALPEDFRAELVREATTIDHEAHHKRPMLDKVEAALDRMSGILKTAGITAGAVVATVSKIRALFGIP